MRISDWSSDVCSSDLIGERAAIVDLRDQVFTLGVIARACEIAAADRTALDADFVRRAVFVADQHLHRIRRAGLGEARYEPTRPVAGADLATRADVCRVLVREGLLEGRMVGVVV